MTVASSRRLRRQKAIIGFSAASLLHAALFYLFVLSLDGPAPVQLFQEGGAPAISVGLIGSSELSSRRLSDVVPLLDFKLNQLSRDDGQTSPPQAANASSVLAEMDAVNPSYPVVQSQPVHQPASARSSETALRLADAPSPWSQVSLSSVDGSKAHELWMSAERCWHGGVSFTPSEIRIDLDGSGAVTHMTWVGGDGDARAQAEAVAAAIVACAPYRTVARAGTYLVVGPLA